MDKLNKKFVKDVDLMFDVGTFGNNYEDGSVEQAYFDNVVYPVYERSNWLNSESSIANSD